MTHISKISLLVKQFLSLETKVKHALIYRVSQAFVGVMNLLVIAHWFSPAVQGYYYTFSSLLALQVLFEMGLSYVILQFAGHEFATLAWDKKHCLQGPPEKVHEFSLFLAKCFKIYSFMSIAAFFILSAAGFYFFLKSPQAHPIVWQWPWILLCLAAALNLWLTPFLSFIEGSGLVTEVNRFRTLQNTAGAIVMWLAMIGGAGLYSIGLDLVVCFAISAVWLWFYYRDLLHKTYSGLQIMDSPIAGTESRAWMQEIWPMQWRIAISWISGYFLNQIYTPIIFHYHNAIDAGKLGLSLAVCNMLSLFAITLVSAHNPEMCRLIAKQEWPTLKALFYRTFNHALLFAIVMASGVMFLMYIPLFNFITSRFVAPELLALLLSGAIVNYMIVAIAQLLRAFKREPFVWISLLGAIFNAALSWWFGVLYSVTGIIFVYLLLNLCYGLPTAWWLLRLNTANLFKTDEKEIVSVKGI